MREAYGKKRMLCGIFLLLLLMAACGPEKGSGQGEPGTGSAAGEGLSDPSQTAQEGDYSWIPEGREWVYLPESVFVEDMQARYHNGMIVGDTFHYYYFEDAPEEIQAVYGDQANRFRELRCCRYNLTTKELEKRQLHWGGESWIFTQMYPSEGPNLWVTGSEPTSTVFRTYAMLFDPDGELLYSEERSEEWEKYDGNQLTYTYLCSGTDSKGRLYEIDADQIVLWDADGTPAGRIRHEEWDYNVYKPFRPVETADGKMILLYRWGGSYQNGFKDGALYRIDFDEKTVVTLAEGMENMEGIGRAPEKLAGRTGYYDLVLYDATSVYGYSIADRKKEELFTWKECNLTGIGVYSMGAMPDGRLYAVIDDYRSDDHRIVLFTEVSREDAPPMTVMTLATVGEIGEDLNATAMRFNRYNFPYRVEVKSYESVNDLYNALLSGEQIDIIDLSRVKLSVLTKRGLLEDLSPYLDQSGSEYHREDFVEGILDAYTVDGVLTGIPDSFSIRTVAGDLERYGGNSSSGSDHDGAGGLTLEAFLAASEKNPGAKLLEEMDGLTREELMQYLLIFNMEEFVDWESGECRFDSDEFKRVLKCVGDLPEPQQNEYDEVMLPEKIKRGEVLYFVADMYRLQALNLYQELYGKDDVCIGFPTPDGSGGHLLIAQDAFGILATSRYKDTAWKFVESVINHRVKYSGGTDMVNLFISYNLMWKAYPSLQKTLDAFLDLAVERNQRSEEMAAGAEHVTYLGFVPEGWDIPARRLSEEELLAGPDLVKDAKPYFDAEGDAIIRIVGEEAPAYYSGQKSLDAVAEIIQNRVNLYVMENR